MRDLLRKAVWLMVVLGLATAVLAQKTTIQLPRDNPVSHLKPGSGEETAAINCSICHSTDYIVRQPHLDAQHWDAEVKKMIMVYGAHVSDEDAKIIADYLANNYGTPAAPK